MKEREFFGVSEFFFELGNEAIVQFDRGDMVCRFKQFFGENAVSGTYFDDVLVGFDLRRGQNFFERVRVDEKVLSQ